MFLILGLFEGAEFDPYRWILLEPIEMGQNCNHPPKTYSATTYTTWQRDI